MTDVMISDEAGADVDGVASDNVEEGGIKDDCEMDLPFALFGVLSTSGEQV